MNTFQLGLQDITVSWLFLDTDGLPVDFAGKDIKACLKVGRGIKRIDADDLVISEGSVSWVIPSESQRFCGVYSLEVEVSSENQRLYRFLRNNAFALVKAGVPGPDTENVGDEQAQIVNLTSIVNLSTLVLSDIRADIARLEADKLEASAIAPEFAPNTPYKIGDAVMYSGKRYVAIEDMPGGDSEFTPAHWGEMDVETVLSAVMGANADLAAKFSRITIDDEEVEFEHEYTAGELAETLGITTANLNELISGHFGGVGLDEEINLYSGKKFSDTDGYLWTRYGKGDGSGFAFAHEDEGYYIKKY